MWCVGELNEDYMKSPLRSTPMPVLQFRPRQGAKPDETTSMSVVARPMSSAR